MKKKSINKKKINIDCQKQQEQKQTEKPQPRKIRVIQNQPLEFQYFPKITQLQLLSKNTQINSLQHNSEEHSKTQLFKQKMENKQKNSSKFRKFKEIDNQQKHNQDNNSKYKGNFGPIRSSKNNRISSGLDRNPQLCKDWNVAGYCAFGGILILLDSCLYIHDRCYKESSELQKQWEQKERKRWKRMTDPDYVSDQEVNLQKFVNKYKPQTECPICQKQFNHPVVTNCGHFFCQKCAIQRNSNNDKCFVCGIRTNGIFNDGIKELENQRNIYNEKVKEMDQEKKKIKEKYRRKGEQYKGDINMKIFGK